MKDQIANQLVKYLEGARSEAHLRLVRAHQHRRPRRAVEEQEDQVRQHAPRADRRARGRRLCAGDEQGVGRALAPLAGAHQRGDGCGQCGARLDTHGRDRRRRADALLRQASAPGSEPARGRVAIRDLPAVRQARLARRLAAPVSGDHREGLHARRERPSGPGAGRRADGHLLQGDRRRTVEARPRQRQGAAQAVARRRGGFDDGPGAARSEDAAHLRRRRHPARRRGGGDARTGRAPLAAGRAHADGQRRAARRSPADPRDDRILGHEIHQRQDCSARTGSWRSAPGSPRPTAVRGKRRTRSGCRPRS